MNLIPQLIRRRLASVFLRLKPEVAELVKTLGDDGMSRRWDDWLDMEAAGPGPGERGSSTSSRSGQSDEPFVLDSALRGLRVR